MASLCFVTTVPHSKRNMPLRRAFRDAGFELNDIKFGELGYHNSAYGPARNSDLVVVDCDPSFLSTNSAVLKSGLIRLKEHFKENSPVFATGNNMNTIIEACADTPIFALDTGCAPENIASILLKTLES